MQPDFESFERRLGYHFNDRNLLIMALTHRSSGAKNNERLEHLGDAVLDLCVSKTLYDLFPDGSEGDLSLLRSQLVRKEALAERARSLRLSDVLVLGESASRSGGIQKDSILADAFEALVGALFVEGGWQICSDIVSSLIPVDEDLIKELQDRRDAKSRLQELCQARGDAPPTYETQEVSGPGHDQHFRVVCRLHGSDQTFGGQGGSRKAAEQEAASGALQFILENEA